MVVNQTQAEILAMIRSRENEIIDKIDGDIRAIQATIRLFARKLAREGARLSFRALPYRLRKRLGRWRFMEIAYEVESMVGSAPTRVEPDNVVYADQAQERARRVDHYRDQHAMVELRYGAQADPRMQRGHAKQAVISDRHEWFSSITGAAAAMKADGYSVTKQNIKASINRHQSKLRVAERYWYPADDRQAGQAQLEMFEAVAA